VSTIHVTDDVRERVRKLTHAGRSLPDGLREEILELGATAVPALLEILEDESLALENGPGDGWAPGHAVRLLGELQVADAIEPMLRVLATTDWLDVLHDRVIQWLPRIGAPVIDPALRAYDDNQDRRFRASVAAVLAEVGVHDDRVFAVLIDQLRDEPSRAANLASYGDERAVPYLLEALENFEIIESGNPLANHALIELRAAIEELGGTLTAEQQLKCRRAREPTEVFQRKMDAILASYQSDVRPIEPAQQREVAPVVPARRRERPGRNDACWCGSARKYKKCCLAADERGAATDGARS
jgi:uncharacterized protein YecA (UPF0149 family)